MNICLTSHLAENYLQLSQITFDQNKKMYAEKYGYDAINSVQRNWHCAIGFDKIRYLRSLLTNYSYEWIWYTGTDSLITNFTLDIADIIDNEYHFIIATDCNGINADSFLIRNSDEGRNYIKMILDHEPGYRNHSWYEQQVIIDTYEANKDIIKLVPQRTFNSYDYNLYPQHENKDKLGQIGQWEAGDLLVHWPGVSLNKRLELVNKYLPLIKYA